MHFFIQNEHNLLKFFLSITFSASKELMESSNSILANAEALQSELEVSGDLAVPAAPDFMVGSEVVASLSLLKEQLLQEGASVIVVTAPGGCGKTTLLKKLCHEAAIKGMCN